MSNLKHAPGGRWFIQPDSYSCSVIDENGGFIASLAKDAPASLIAAAPDMLDALIYLLRVADPYRTGGMQHQRDAISMSLAAIEKATGMKIEEALK